MTGKLKPIDMTMKHCVVVTSFARTQPGYLDFAYRIEALSRRYEVSLVSDHPLNVLEMALNRVQHHVLPGGKSQLDGSAI